MAAQQMNAVYNLLQNKPTAPVVLHEATGTPLECNRLRAHSDFFVSTAFVRLVGTWVNTREQSNFQFVLPTPGTVTSIAVRIGKNRLVETRVISREKANKHRRGNNNGQQDPNAANSSGDIQSQQQSVPSYSEYIPDLFRFPIIGVETGEFIEVDVQYLEPLAYYDQHYHFTLPLSFPQYALARDKSLDKIVKVTAAVHTITDGVSLQVFSSTHDLKQEAKLPQVLLTMQGAHEQNDDVYRSQYVIGHDFKLAYTLAAKDIQGILLKSQSKSASKSSAPKRRLGNLLGRGDSSSVEKKDAADSAGFEDIEMASKDKVLSVEEAEAVAASPSVRDKDDDESEEAKLNGEGDSPKSSKKDKDAAKKDKKRGKKGKRDKEDQDGSFCLFVSPPTVESVKGYFQRNIIFLLDRSGSMVGDPFGEAVRALSVALEQLRPTDRFNCVSFDHRQVQFKNELVAATPENIASAKRWIPQYAPERGGTDIESPLLEALTLLESIGAKNDSVNFVVLLTDGCVAEERTICKTAAENCSFTRVLTFGIGTYCNWYFLKMLAEIGRGFDDVVVYRENIFRKITRLLARASVPVLTNIELDMPGLEEVELYPFPIPDLFLNGPLTIAGRFRGQFPKVSTVQGQALGGESKGFDVVTKVMKNFPVEKVFIKNRLDLLTAKAWLQESKNLEREVVDLSIANSMPCAHTTLVAVEHETDDAGNPIKKTSRRKKGAFIVGGAFLVGAAAFSFGSLAGTVGNAPAVMSDFAVDGDCCGDCGDCDCGDCADCLVC